MKKIMMTLAAAMMTVCASAQIYVGGALGFTSEKADIDGAKATTNFTINPEVGYNLNEDWAVGINIGYTSTKAGDADAVGTFKVAPYARYTYAKLGNVNLFLDGQIDYATKKDTYDQMGLHIVPGVAVNVSDKVSFVAKMGDGLGWSQTKNKGNDVKTNKLGLDLNTLSNIEFGVYFNF